LRNSTNKPPTILSVQG